MRSDKRMMIVISGPHAIEIHNTIGRVTKDYFFTNDVLVNTEDRVTLTPRLAARIGEILAGDEFPTEVRYVSNRNGLGIDLHPNERRTVELRMRARFSPDHPWIEEIVDTGIPLTEWEAMTGKERLDAGDNHYRDWLYFKLNTSWTPVNAPTPADAAPHTYAGSDKARQGEGKSGHCDDCVKVGHVVAHPDLGCGDVGCNAYHPEADA